VCVASPSASQQALLSIHCLHLIAREKFVLTRGPSLPFRMTCKTSASLKREEGSRCCCQRTRVRRTVGRSEGHRIVREICREETEGR